MAAHDEVLMNACWNGDLTAAKTAVAAGASLQKTWVSGWTPLFAACYPAHKPKSQMEQRKRRELVTWILDHPDGRATLNWTVCTGKTPLIAAVENCASSAIVHMLLCKGANPTLRDVAGRDAQYFAMVMGRLSCTILLVNGVREWPVTRVGEWRPHLQSRFPCAYRQATRTLIILGKARDTEKSTEKMWHMRYSHACLCLLPEELLQYLFALLTCAPLPTEWLPATFPGFGR
jgi:hypothetical protein